MISHPLFEFKKDEIIELLNEYGFECPLKSDNLELETLIVK